MGSRSATAAAAAVSVSVAIAVAVAVAASALALLGCPPKDMADKSDGGGASPPAATACARFGQTCEYAPGKLGSCVVKEPCNDPPAPSDVPGRCFVCQSQH